MNLNMMSSSRLDDYEITSTFVLGICKLIDKRARNRVMDLISKSKTDGLHATRLVVPRVYLRRFLKVKTAEAIHELDENADSVWHNRMPSTTVSTIQEMIRTDQYGMNTFDTLSA